MKVKKLELITEAFGITDTLKQKIGRLFEHTDPAKLKEAIDGFEKDGQMLMQRLRPIIMKLRNDEGFNQQNMQKLVILWMLDALTFSDVPHDRLASFQRPLAMVRSEILTKNVPNAWMFFKELLSDVIEEPAPPEEKHEGPAQPEAGAEAANEQPVNPKHSTIEEPIPNLKADVKMSNLLNRVKSELNKAH